MELYVVDKNTRRILDLIRTATFSQYTDEFVGEGSFQLNVPANDGAFPHLLFGNYIIFDKSVVGIIKDVQDSQEEINEIVVTGRLSNHILCYRSIERSVKIEGTITSIARTLVDRYFINPDDIRRKIDYVKLSENVEYIPDSESITLCETGKNIRETISTFFLPYNYGFELHPVLVDVDADVPESASISEFEFRVLKPVDRTVGNDEGNTPVVFAFQLNNLSRLESTKNGSSYASTALVAGEGEGQRRKMIEVGDTEASGIDRIEIYIDARDLQSEDENAGTSMSPAAYEKLLKQRGLEKLEGYKIFETFDAGVLIEENNSFRYGKDFFKGDWVTILDDKTGNMYSVQVSSVVKSVSNGIEHFDINFGIDSVSMNSITDTSTTGISSGGSGNSGGGSGGSGGTGEATTVTVDVSETVTGAPGTSANVENVGNNVNVVLRFTIPRGQQGQRGEKGETGDNGLSAYQLAVQEGFKGTLDEYLQSLHGVDGQPGKDGENGTDGEDGVDGKSAYELAVENGYEGTLAEWLASLKGEKGDPGGIENIDILTTEEEIKANSEYGKLVDAIVIKDIYEKGVGGGSVTVATYDASIAYLNSDTQDELTGGEIAKIETLTYDESLQFLNSTE